MANPFENHYCPICLEAVNPASGDHWDVCEYEASFGEWVNPVRPLTELQMLNRRLGYCTKEINRLNKYKKRLKERISQCKARLNDQNG